MSTETILLNWLRDLPIRKKLTLVILYTSAVALLLLCSVLGAFQYFNFHHMMARDTIVLADILAKNTQAALTFQDENAAQQTLSSLQAKPSVLAAGLYDENGNRFAEYVRDNAAVDLPDRPSADGSFFESDKLVVFRPVLLNGKRIGTIYLQTSLQELYDHLKLFTGLSAVVFVGSVFVAFILASWLQRPISQPILNLAETARRIAENKDYAVRVEAKGRDETGLMTNAFNQLLVSIEEGQKALRTANDSLQKEVAERKDAQEKVHQINTELEARVAERTVQLETSNKELEAFSYSVSHDLRAPLRAMDGFSQAVLEDFGEQLPPEGLRYLRNIRQGAQRMGTLIDDLLSFSRLGRLPIDKHTVDNDSLVHDVLNDLSSEREGRQIDIRIGHLPSCQGDSALLKQVWTNLLSNAIKYTRHRNPAVIEIGCKVEQESVYFVRDNGAGFDMRYANKLFGVFQRLHPTDQFEGTGVGLAFVQRIVQRHGGRIWAEAEVDKGACFYFTLHEEGKP
ncbi:MAG: ATP-binding protein [Methylacidiphilales bacterium]|nr:ATP-binding protein [Candidatus Methylacidiphilales bacterium]